MKQLAARHISPSVPLKTAVDKWGIGNLRHHDNGSQHRQIEEDSGYHLGHNYLSFPTIWAIAVKCSIAMTVTITYTGPTQTAIRASLGRFVMSGIQ